MSGAKTVGRLVDGAIIVGGLYIVYKLVEKGQEIIGGTFTAGGEVFDAAGNLVAGAIETGGQIVTSSGEVIGSVIEGTNNWAVERQAAIREDTEANRQFWEDLFGGGETTDNEARIEDSDIGIQSVQPQQSIYPKTVSVRGMTVPNLIKIDIVYHNGYGQDVRNVSTVVGLVGNNTIFNMSTTSFSYLRAGATVIKTYTYRIPANMPVGIYDLTVAINGRLYGTTTAVRSDTFEYGVVEVIE